MSAPLRKRLPRIEELVRGVGRGSLVAAYDLAVIVHELRWCNDTYSCQALDLVSNFFGRQHFDLRELEEILIPFTREYVEELSSLAQEASNPSCMSPGHLMAVAHVRNSDEREGLIDHILNDGWSERKVVNAIRRNHRFVDIRLSRWLCSRAAAASRVMTK